MLDFRELAGNGRGLEQLVREILLLRGFRPQWSGEGPDGGRDLVFFELGSELLGGKTRKWLVSCKDNSSSGRAVGAEAAVGVVEELRQHGAQGFLLVCTTYPTTPLVTRLEALDRDDGQLHTHYWDGVALERLLGSPRGWSVAQQFMPVSSSAAGWKVFATEAPNQWLAAHRGFYFHLSARTAGGIDYDFQSLDARIDEILAVAAKFSITLRLRGIFHNDTHGAGYCWYIDCFPRLGVTPPSERDLLMALRDDMTREDGQLHTFDLLFQTLSGSDHFDYDHYDHYRRLPSYV